jgi:hypothetical protein
MLIDSLGPELSLTEDEEKSYEVHLKGGGMQPTYFYFMAKASLVGDIICGKG